VHHEHVRSKELIMFHGLRGQSEGVKALRIVMTL
jgi:hypothetical protein